MDSNLTEIPAKTSGSIANLLIGIRITPGGPEIGCLEKPQIAISVIVYCIKNIRITLGYSQSNAADIGGSRIG
jgi:hypothetical protein